MLCVLAFILKRGMCFLIGKFYLNLVFPFVLISSKFVTVRNDEMLVTLLCNNSEQYKTSGSFSCGCIKSVIYSVNSCGGVKQF